MATRKNAATETTPEVATAPAPVEGSARTRGNYKDEPIELAVESTDRPYSEAVTPEQLELLEKYGVRSA